MNSKVIIAVAVVVVLVGAGAGAFFLMKGDDKKDKDYTMDGADLKVLGNANGDRTIDQSDVDLIKSYVNDSKEVKDYPLADANNDGVLDQSDIDLVTAIAAGQEAIVWHINYKDADGNGTMDTQLVSTKFPVSSTIISASANTAILCYLVGINEEVKGAAYSGTSMDKYLYEKTFRDTKKVTQVGTSATTIPIESGNIGSDKTISASNVSCLLTDWNKTYITNEDKFEAAHVDVVRVAASSFDPVVYTHSILLLGFLFQKEDIANKTLDLYNETYDNIKDAVSGIEKKHKAVASSMEGYVSSEDSDYTQFLVAAGAEFGLEGYNFGGSSAILVADNLGIYDTTKYDFDYIVHVRTTLGYDTKTSTYASDWQKYTAAYARWQHSDTGQYLVSGVIPVPARIAYCAYAMYGAEVSDLSLDWANDIHAKFIQMYPGDYKNESATGHSFVIKENPKNTIIYQKIEGENIWYNSVEKKFYGTYAAGLSHSMTVATSDPSAVVKYGTTEGEYNLSACPAYEEKGTYNVFFQITSEGKTTVEDKLTFTIADAIEYTVSGYTGTVDGSNHYITVDVTTPGTVVKYGDSASKCTKDSYGASKAGTTVVYFVITGDGLVSVHGSAEVTLTAAA